MNMLKMGMGLACALAGALTAGAHCDTLAGPIIPEARAALEKGNITPVLKWVKPEAETELKNVFEQAAAVRKGSPEARDLADRYFLETLIRLHRAGEGAPYTGLKDEPVSPFIELAESTLREGSPDALLKRMTGHLESAVREQYAAVAEAAKSKDQSVETGRAYVKAYVTYMHFLEDVRDAIMAGAAEKEKAHAH